MFIKDAAGSSTNCFASDLRISLRGIKRTGQIEFFETEKETDPETNSLKPILWCVPKAIISTPFFFEKLIISAAGTPVEIKIS